MQVIHYFSPLHGGGSVNVAYSLSKHLAKRGHKVTILTTDFEFDKEYVKTIENEGVEVIQFHCIANIGLFLFSPGMKRWLKDNIGKFDIIHMHNYRSYQNNVVYKSAKKFDVPYILQAHGSILPFFAKKRLKKVYDWVCGYKLLKYASQLIALTNTELQQYKKMGVPKEKIEIIPNGIDLSEYENLPERGKFRKKYGINDDEKIILFLGRIHKIKGVDLLIDVFAASIKIVDNVKLVVVGPDDGFLPTIRRQVEDLKICDKIVFTGPLYGKDKLKAYVDSDLYVLPSRYETFPSTILEAWACERPVIVTDRCGIASTIKKAGKVVNFDKYQLSEAIINYLVDEELRNRTGKKGKMLVNKLFNWSKVVSEIENMYKRIL